MAKTADEIAQELRTYARQLLAAAEVLEAPPHRQRSLQDVWVEEYEGPPPPKPTRRRSAASIAKQKATIAARRSGKKREVRLRVLSSTKPTPQELEDREVVHATEEPA